jgi:hypothetical protein
MLQLTSEPGSGEAPVSIGSSFTDLHDLSTFRKTASYKETQLNQFCFVWILHRKTLQRSFKVQQVYLLQS